MAGLAAQICPQVSSNCYLSLHGSFTLALSSQCSNARSKGNRISQVREPTLGSLTLKVLPLASREAEKELASKGEPKSHDIVKLIVKCTVKAGYMIAGNSFGVLLARTKRKIS